ncbi:GNAT family N-acetyltransferase [Acinetobacter sp. S40]|uniref:GNAT family N-acetyltransferase n=1 Tax=unclassified Acinetobacter TaxID=196816 RepID=UPI001909B76D|nr:MULTISPECIES: GNAT family N-acetyltransferase [unclassified Acinetobacter]MBJ9984969.1 GNAT family N-acetyltransferase [Acinetobacter sp. S40]MBK0063040.1 GNAT family N-acetyltransferase [Acinetobacter sp. S55]MBK0066542.1 GNAT family N-acetyltransferase [Acinetobacter sp. S54]
MIVRRATLEDLNQLAVLFDEYRQFYGASSNLKQSYDFLKQRFENKESVIFIHVKDDVFTGFVLLYLGFSSVACSKYYILDDVYVTPVYRRQGSARQLIDTAILFARHESALRISLETQRTNVESQRLYESMGFIQDDEFLTYHCFLK